MTACPHNPSTVYCFVTCLSDMIFTKTGLAGIRLLQQRYPVIVPSGSCDGTMRIHPSLFLNTTPGTARESRQRW